MSWVCPMCSTNNEDSESKCIVCESARPVESTKPTPPPETHTAPPPPRPRAASVTTRGSTYTAPSYRDTSYAKPKTNWIKTAAKIILLIICAIVLTPFVLKYTLRYQLLKNSLYTTVIVSSFILLFIASVFTRFSGSDGKRFVKVTQIIPITLILLGMYVYFTVLSDYFRRIFFFISAGLALIEVVHFIITAVKRKRRFLFILLWLMATTGLLIWRIIVE